MKTTIRLRKSWRLKMIKNKCCLCNKEINGYGNNPEPLKRVADGWCCDSCNITRVIPERIKDYHMSIKKSE